MRIREWMLGILLTLNCCQQGWAQTCTNPLKSISYDTVFMGSGNATNTLTFPKFDPVLGTLMSVQFQSEITLLYNYELENRDSITISNYRVRVYREDELTGSAILSPLNFLYNRTYGPFTLTAWDGVPGGGTDYMSAGPLYVMNRMKFTGTVYNTADYLGTGSLDFDYNSNTYSSIIGSVNYNFNANAKDTVRFKVTYFYCANIFLKADLTSFLVLRKDEDQSRLMWKVDNEEAGRTYETEVSLDGKNFMPLGRIRSNPDLQHKGNYTFDSDLTPYRNNRVVFYRIKQVDADGTIKYSSIQSLNLESSGLPPFRVFPNPASQYTQVTINRETYGNWQVELYSMKGELFRKQVFNRTRSIRLESLGQLPKGMYLLKITDMDSREGYRQQLLIQ